MGTHTRAEQLKRAEYFLKAIVPEAEKANVRLALHPNDPPVPISRGSEQIMATLAHWKEYLNLVKSPFNGMTFDCGVTREMGEDPVAVCRYLAARVSVLVDDPGVAPAVPESVGIFIDVNIGMDRTGLAPEDREAPEGFSEEAILRATQLAVSGASRGEIESTLRSEFGLSDPSTVVGEILGEAS